MTDQIITLEGRVFLRFNIRALSGLHIGGTETGVEIGGVDNTVIRDPVSNQPYIPGSSLRGKMRSLTEKYKGAPQNTDIGRVKIHSCKDREAYEKCAICQVYGVPAERDFSTPTRLIVRDVSLTKDSVKKLEDAETDFPYTEVKTEVAIDRVTSMATPRQLERVPAGAVFGESELVYSIYSGTDCAPEKDIDNLETVFLGLQLLEDDYLGGMGSRGSGRIGVEDIRVGIKGGDKYGPEPEWLVEGLEDLAALEEAKKDILQKIRERLLAQE
ncbi:MAG: type III-A CRISPR-associated RAMP protein Csm3 [Chloroflexota bacterium]|nr:type III-A CRISPR-associated RAMP protein Csm3 [Chloroflexota bacterium]